MWKLISVAVALTLPTSSAFATGVPVKFTLALAGSNHVDLAWIAIPGSVYALNSTTNLLKPWQSAPGQPATFSTTNNTLGASLPVDATTRFFQVVLLDTQGPQVYQTSPLNNAIGVGQRTVLQAWLRDTASINTNTIVLTIGTNSPVTLTDPRLAWSTNNVLTYTPGTNEVLGAPGQIVSASLSAADSLGNATTNFSWSFQLALTTVPSSNIVFLGSGTNPPANLVLLSTNGSTFTYSYTGSSSGLSNGMQLINSSQTNGYAVTVVSFTDQPTNNTVAVVTQPALLAELLQQGSLATGAFTEVTSGGAPHSPQLGLQLNYSYPLNQVLYNDGNLEIATTSGSALNLGAELEITANFSGFSLTAVQATVQGTASFQLDVEATAQAAESYSGSVVLVPPVSTTYFGTIGVVPVWLTVKFEIDAGFDASLEAQGQISSGVSASDQVLFGQAWDQKTGWTTINQNPGGSLSFETPSWQIQGSAGVTVYLLPKVTLLVNSLAGVTGDLKPYADLQYTFQLNPEQCNLSLYGGLNSDFALDLTVWDSNWGQLPSATFTLIPETLLWQTNCTDLAPEIVSEPVSQSVQVGEPAIFEVQAQGSEPMTYQWMRDGLPLTDVGSVTGSATATLTIDNAQTSDAGGYSVVVKNAYGSTNSTTAELTVSSWTGTWAGTFNYQHETDQYDPGVTNECLYSGVGDVTNYLTVAVGVASGSAMMDGIGCYDSDTCSFLDGDAASGTFTGTASDTVISADFTVTLTSGSCSGEIFPFSFTGTLDATQNTITGTLYREDDPTFTGTMTLNRQPPPANPAITTKTESLTYTNPKRLKLPARGVSD